MVTRKKYTTPFKRLSTAKKAIEGWFTFLDTTIDNGHETDNANICVVPGVE